MPHSPGKFCLDRNLVRWSLMRGSITRKTQTDGPTDGQEVSIDQISGIEKTSFVKVGRPRFGWAAMLLGVAILAVSWPVDFMAGRIVLGLLGILVLYWGSQRIRPHRSVYDAYQLLIAGMKPEEWIVVGSTPEVLGFIEAVRSELSGNRDARKTTLI